MIAMYIKKVKKNASITKCIFIWNVVTPTNKKFLIPFSIVDQLSFPGIYLDNLVFTLWGNSLLFWIHLFYISKTKEKSMVVVHKMILHNETIRRNHMVKCCRKITRLWSFLESSSTDLLRKAIGKTSQNYTGWDSTNCIEGLWKKYNWENLKFWRYVYLLNFWIQR